MTEPTALATDLRKLVKQLRAIDATVVTFSIIDGELVAWARGDHTFKATKLCRNHDRYVPYCQTKPPESKFLDPDEYLGPCLRTVKTYLATATVRIPIQGSPTSEPGTELVMSVKALAKHLVKKTGRLKLKI